MSYIGCVVYLGRVSISRGSQRPTDVIYGLCYVSRSCQHSTRVAEAY